MKRKRSLVALAAASCGLFSNLGIGYETQTHGYLTSKAFDLSDLGNANSQALLMRLGVDRLDTTVPFSIYWNAAVGAGYYDNLADGTGPLSYLRPTTDYEKRQMQQLAYRPPNLPAWISQTTVESPNSSNPLLPLANWIVRGAIREDDLKPGDYNPKDGPSPDPDPRAPFERPFNHFYDPIHDVKLTPFGASCTLIPGSGGHCDKAVDWALGTSDAFTSLTPDPSRNNHFSWADARTNMFLALTTERDANSDGVRSASEREADAEERLYRWATTFRSLGDVVHLLEDMAQPQHSRNDRHDPYSTYLDPERQAFEAFTNARLIGANNVGGVGPTAGEQYVRSLNGLPISQSYLTPPLDANGYPPPSFSTPLRFFTTRLKADTASTDPSPRLGLADYTNRGFFTRGTLPDSSGFDFPPTPVADGVNGYTAFTSFCGDFPSLLGRHPQCTRYSHTVPDLVQPNRPDVTSKEPIVAVGMWNRGSGFTTSGDFAIGPPGFQVQADLAFPRAIAYGAGLLNFFFRGQLAVTAPPDGAVGVLNQGAQHTMNAQGYPCVGTASNDGCPIFGFMSIRVSVLNGTPPITESGPPNSQNSQNLSATVAGDLTNPNTRPALVAVAKYHRNTCYKPDMTGERVQSYAPSPQLIIAEPVCSAGQTVRTAYQEISVSQSVAVTSAQLNGTSPIEVHFDFSADPVPVNATDLFIQVVYRGPMGDAVLGQEPDAIAVGTLDVREPTFVAFWNNTDYFWNNTSWLPHNSSYPNQGIKDFWVCAANSPPKLVFYYTGASGFPAMIDPVAGSNVPGMVRLGMIFPLPIGLGRKINRGVPVPYFNAGYPPVPLQSTFTAGQFRQANLENVTAATLNAPSATCGAGFPNTPQYWCFDPIQKRRGVNLGAAIQPFYDIVTGSFNTPPDVDASGLTVFTGITALATGAVHFDTDATLGTCPTQPPIAPLDPASVQFLQERARLIELQEEAADLGIDEK